MWVLYSIHGSCKCSSFSFFLLYSSQDWVDSNKASGETGQLRLVISDQNFSAFFFLLGKITLYLLGRDNKVKRYIGILKLETLRKTHFFESFRLELQRNQVCSEPEKNRMRSKAEIL